MARSTTGVFKSSFETSINEVVNSPIGLSHAYDSALSGIRRAERNLNQAAADVAENGRATNEAAHVTLSTQGRTLASAESAETPNTAAGFSRATTERATPELAQAMVNQNLAKYELAANVRVAQTANEMHEELARIVNR